MVADKRVIGFVLAAAALLAGCGGNGGRSSSSTAASGAVVLPAGFQLQMSQLAVSTESGQIAVSAKGTFSVPVSSTGPRLVQLVDTVNNKIVLLGYVDSASSGSAYAGGHGQISAATTATALLFMGLDGPELPTGSWDDFQTSIAGSTQVAQVASVVSTSVIANPTAISDGDTAIENAVNAVQNSAVSGASIVARRSPSIAVNRVVVFQPGTRGGSTDTLVNVTPGTPESGMIVEPNPAGNGIVFVNNYRRRAVAYVYEVAKGQTVSTTQPLSAPIEFASGEAIEPEEALDGAVVSVVNGLQGKFAFLPVTTGPINLTSDQGAPVTVYDVVVVGPGSTNNMGSIAQAVWPAGQSEQAALVAEWTKSLPLTTAKSVAEDIVLPLFFHMLLSHQQAEVFRTNEALDAGTEQLMESLADVSNAVEAGNLKLASTNFINDILKSTGTQEAFVNLIETNIVNSGGISAENLEKTLERLESAATVLEIINTSFVAVDLSRLFADAIASNIAETWTATVLPAKVALSPSQGIVNATNNISTFTASVQGATDLSQYEFRWSTSGTMGSLEEPNGSVAMPAGLTSFSSAAYLANLKELKSGETDTVTVTVYDSGGSEVGTATSTVIDQEGQENVTPQLQMGINFPSPGPGNGTVWTEADVVSFPLVKNATAYLIELVQNGTVLGRWSFSTTTGQVTTTGLNGPVIYVPVMVGQGSISIAYDGEDEAELSPAAQQIQLQSMQNEVAGVTAQISYQ
jgi:hypothetical protein